MGGDVVLNEVIKIAVIATVGVVALLLLKGSANTFTIVVEIATVFLVLLVVIPYIKEILGVLNGLQNINNSGSTAIKIMFKAFIVLTVGGVTADICRDNSAGAVAGVVETSVKILALSIALPVFSSVIEVVSAIFNG